MTRVRQRTDRARARRLLTIAAAVGGIGLWLFGFGGTREAAPTAALDPTSTLASAPSSSPVVTSLRLTDAFVYSTAKVQRHERWNRALAQGASGVAP